MSIQHQSVTASRIKSDVIFLNKYVEGHLKDYTIFF